MVGIGDRVGQVQREVVSKHRLESNRGRRPSIHAAYTHAHFIMMQHKKERHSVYAQNKQVVTAGKIS